jgi:hypothetical protein
LEKNAVVHSLFGFIMVLNSGYLSDVSNVAGKTSQNLNALTLLPKNSPESCRKLEERC